MTQNYSVEGRDTRKCLGGATSKLRHLITNISFVADSRPLYWSVKKNTKQEEEEEQKMDG